MSKLPALTLITSFLILFVNCGDGVNSPRVTIFMTSQTYQGQNVGNRVNSDFICQSEWDLKAGYLANVSKRSNTHAMVAYSNGDDMAHFSQNYQLPDRIPVYVANSNISDSWMDLLQRGPRFPLNSVAPFSSLTFWTGSDSFGNFVSTSNNCTNWMTSPNGNYGSVSSTGGGFLNSGNSACSGPTYPILCVTY